MSIEQAKGILELGNLLEGIWKTLDATECMDWGSLPADEGEEPERGAKYALANLRAVRDVADDAKKLAKQHLDDAELRQQVREVLLRTDQILLEADFPDYLAEEEGEEPYLETCRATYQSAAAECGAALRKLSARVLILGEDACDAINRNVTSPGEDGPRPAYKRDHEWLLWHEEEKMGPAAIRDRWDSMSDQERRRICPQCCQTIGGKDAQGKEAGRETVKTALRKAKSERK